VIRALRALAAAALLAAVPGVAAAQEPVTTVDWTATPPLSGSVVDGNVRVAADVAGGDFPLVTLDVADLDLGTVGYAVRGNVRYSDVVVSDPARPGYLQMWSTFADGGRYFSRTLASEGPMAALQGTADWRPFELPFFLQGHVGPTRLEIAVVLPGSGTVDVGPLELVRLDAESASGGAWLSDRAIGVAGAAVGTAVGILAVAVAVLTGRRSGRRFVLPAMAAAAVVGVGLIVVSIVALATGQPPNVVLLLLVPGLVLAAVFGGSIPRTRRLYADAELRKMRAMDQV
jgi:hypothetical protein